jgi:integrase
MKTTRQSDRKDAVKELARIMQPFLVADDVRTLETVKARIEGAKADLVKMDEEKNPPLTFGAAWSAYLTAPGRPDSGPATLRQYEAEFNRFLKWIEAEHTGIQTLRALTPEIAGAYAQHLTGSKATPSTFNQHIGFLRLLWRVLAKPARMDAPNPWTDIKRKRLVTQGRRELTIEELRRVCQAATGELRIMLAIGLYTGLRQGDCATLRWSETDIIRGIIRRVPMKTARRSGKPVMIPLHPVLLAMLAEIPTAGRKEYVLPQMATRYQKDRSSLNNCVQDHFEAQGVKTIRDTPGLRQRALVDVGFHSLRHSFVSLCRAANAPLSVVESIVGHSNPAMTRHYTHTSEAAAGVAVAALPDITGQATVTPALPAADEMISKAKVRELVETLNHANLKERRTQLLSLVAQSTEQ